MKITKKLFLIAALSAFASMIFAQEQSVQRKTYTEKETSVENEYLNDIDSDIIMGLATADDLDNKLVALQYIQNAIEDGNVTPTIVEALDQLSGEGIVSQARTNGRLVNNYPEVRRQSCLLMSQIPTEHTKNQLIDIAIADNEPMVIAAAVKSLGDIKPEQADEVIAAIAFANKRNQVLNPTSSLAYEVLVAFEQLAPLAENRKEMIDCITRISTDYHYNTVVRNKAYKLLKTLSNTSSSKKVDAK